MGTSDWTVGGEGGYQVIDAGSDSASANAQQTLHLWGTVVVMVVVGEGVHHEETLIYGN